MKHNRTSIRAGFPLLFAVLAFFLLSRALRAEIISSPDATGEKLTFEYPPRRIISLNPDFTENLFALGAGENLVAVTNFCDYPEEARTREDIGNLSTPNLEKIFSLSPDLVLATKEGNRPQTVNALRKLGIKVFVTGPAITFEDYFELLEQLGRILGREESGRELVDRLKKKIDYYRARSRESPPIRIFFQIGSRPIVSANKNTLIHGLITAAGGTNLAADALLRYPVYSREKVIADDPEVIIIAAMGNEINICRKYWERFPEIQAIKNNRIHRIDPDLVCRLSPRLFKGLEQISRLLHPEWFDKDNR